jgi:F-type H+-transporting ATPase subunit b
VHAFIAVRLLAQATTTTTAPTAISKNPILPAGNEILWGTFSFVILFLVMWKFAFPAVAKSMQARTDKIRNNIDEAQKVRNEAEQILADYQRQLADARGEANRIIEEARQAAEQLRQDMVRRADSEVAELRQRNAAELAAAQERALSQLQNQVRSLAIELAEKVVGANLDRDRNLALVDQYIAELNTERSAGAGQQGRS